MRIDDLRGGAPNGSAKELTPEEMRQIFGGECVTLNYTHMQWEYTKQDDTGAAKAL